VSTGGGDGMTRIETAFADRKASGGKALVVYVMAGDPDPAFTERLVPKLAQAGADVVELGFPFSDPVADGPVIQAAGQRAMRHLRALPRYLELVARIRQQTDVPLVCMTYYNPIFRYGEARFLADARAAGLDGVILPDVPVDEAQEWQPLCVQAGVAPIFLEAPNTGDAQQRRIAEGSRGFVYLVSLKGVTGADQGLGQDLEQRVRTLRGLTDTPLAVGFGISTPEQARQAAALCDGVVVGSGVIRRIASEGDPDANERAVLDYVRELRAALD